MQRNREDFKSLFPKKLPHDIQCRAFIKLHMIDTAEVIDDLLIPPANYLEQHKGERVGQYSIRIDDQWRVCFVWQNSNAYDVEIADYH